MAPTLLLRIPAAGQEETEWLVLDGSGETAATRQRGTLSLAAAVWRSGPVLALAPSSQILLAEPELPPGGGAKLARAVPFALEEQLTEDVDLLTFAIGKRRDSGTTPAAVVSRSVLQGWLSELRSAGLGSSGHLSRHFPDAGESRPDSAMAGERPPRGASPRRPALCGGIIAGERGVGGGRRDRRSAGTGA